MLIKTDWIVSERRTVDGKYSISIDNMDYADFIKLKKSFRRETLNKIDRRKSKVKCVDTGEIFNSIKEACDKYNLDSGNIAKCCLGKLKTTGGFEWEYVHELETK